MVDPREQARIDRETGDKAFPSESIGWSKAEWQAYGRERQRLMPVRGPAPWRRVALETLLVAAAAELVRPLARSSLLLAEVALLPLEVTVSRATEGLDRDAALRRGVAIAGDGPDWPPPPMTASFAFGAGSSAAVTWLRYRTRQPVEDAGSVIVVRLVVELHHRWRWRHHPVLGD